MTLVHPLEQRTRRVPFGRASASSTSITDPAGSVPTCGTEKRPPPRQKTAEPTAKTPARERRYG